MALDDCLDVVKDASKALGMYNPAKIDPQLQEHFLHDLQEMAEMYGVEGGEDA